MRSHVPKAVVDAGWASVREVLDDALASDRASDIGWEGALLSVFDRNGEVILEHGAGTSPVLPEQRMPVASASKIVAALVVLRLIDRGVLHWDDTLGGVLGWRDAQAGAATVDQLGAMVGGLNTFSPLMFDPSISLQECVARLEKETGPFAEPGNTMCYSGAQLHALAAMCEVKSGMSWAALFEAEVKAPLGLTDDGLVFATIPGVDSPVVSDNPMVSGGLIATPREFRRILQVVLEPGDFVTRGNLGRLFRNPYARAENVSDSNPLLLPCKGKRYGFGCWLEGAGAPGEIVQSSGIVSSPGFNGFCPWVDRDAGYGAILAAHVQDGQIFGLSVATATALMRPIADAVTNRAPAS